MIPVGKWRWPLVVLLPLVIGAALFALGLVRFNYEGKVVLQYLGDPKTIDLDFKLFRQAGAGIVTVEKVPGQPAQITLATEAPWPNRVVESLSAAGQASVKLALAKHRETMKKAIVDLQTQNMDFEKRFNQLNQDRKTLLIGSKRHTPKAELLSKIETLKARRRQLIEHYPTHSDIPLLATQIQDLLRQMGSHPTSNTGRIAELDRQIAETKVRQDYFARRLQDLSQAEHALKPEWRLQQPIQKPQRPHRVDGWPIGTGGMAAGLALGLILFKGGKKATGVAAGNGLWRPTSEEVPKTPVEKPVELQVVSPEPVTAVAAEPATTLPSDPMTQKAAELYAKWIEVSKILYTPAPEAPQGVLDSIGPLLQESSDFLPDGHDVLAKYLARSVVPGDLPAHVARTVLMTLTGAQEAGVSPEHRLAMALAALFHDLAIVPRPAAQQDEVGSEVGRLSASVLRRIPGLQPALLSMVEDILIGMDEFKLETWQNVTSGANLEPLSKVLREIDRFEKVMQKQKSRLDRRVANQ